MSFTGQIAQVPIGISGQTGTKNQTQVLPSHLITTDDTNEPDIPREYRKTVSDFVTAMIMLDKQDSRAASVMEIGVRGLKAMAWRNHDRMNKNSQDFAKIHPRQSAHKSSITDVLRTESGKIVG